MEGIEEIRKRLADWIAFSGKSQTEIARSMGISASTLSMFIKGTYAGNNEEIARKALSVMDLVRNQSTAIKKPDFVKTKTAEEIITVAHYAQNHCDIGVVYGDAGIGKTMAITEFAKNNPWAIMITADVTSTIKSLLDDVLEKLGVRSATANRIAAKKQVIQELKGSNRMIIIDEAQHLKLPTLEAVRGILYDACKCAVLLVGNESIYSKLLGKQKAPFAQLFSRVGICRGFSLAKSKIPREDIKAVLCQDVELSDVCIDYLHNVASKSGGLRSAVKLFVMSWEVAIASGEEINLEMIHAAESYLLRI